MENGDQLFPQELFDAGGFAHMLFIGALAQFVYQFHRRFDADVSRNQRLFETVPKILVDFIFADERG